MYGLVNKAIEQMVCTNFGEETWQKIKQKAEINVDMFLSMEGYPDDITHRLVRAASEVLNLPSADIMHAFGEYWVTYTSEEGYGEMMAMSGNNLPEFLGNLDDLHARVGVVFPKLQPPSFECSETDESLAADEESLQLHYYSERDGLAPMVVGLVKGLGKRFDTEVDITQTSDRNDGADHDEFLVKYKAGS
jgi:Haem-NO-binding